MRGEWGLPKNKPSEKEESKMSMVTNQNRGIGALLKILLIVVLAVSILTPALAYGGTDSGSGAASTGGGKSFDDALNIIGDDGKINTSSTIATSSTEGGLNGFIAKYKSLISGLCGVLTVTMIGFFALNITKLGAAGDNEMARKKATNGLLFSAIAVVLFGGMSVFIGLFWNVLA